MELTVNIKEQSKIAQFLNLIKEIDYIEIIDVKETSEIPVEHLDILNKRLQKIENKESSFKSWDSIKKKYEERTL